MTALAIRRARRDDVPALVALYADDVHGAARETPDDLAPYYAAFDAMAAEPHQELVVAEQEGRVVGTLQLTFIRQLSGRGGTVAQLEAVRIARDLRGRGLGGELLAWAIARARAAGCRRVQLTTNKSRVDAQRFYARLGFVASHEGMKLAL